MLPMSADRATVLRWMSDTGSGYRVAAKHFDLKVGTVKSWQQRARKQRERDRDADEQDIGDVEKQNRLEFLTAKVRDIELKMAKASPGVLAGLMKQQAIFHAELVGLVDQQKRLDGEFADPTEMVEQIVVGAEAAVSLYTREQAERLMKVAMTACRLTAADDEDATLPP